MKLKSLKFNYVAVVPFDADKTTKGGIVLPDTHDADIRKGRVEFAGPGRFEYGKFVETTLAPGDVVFFSRHSAGVLIDDDEHGELLIFRDSEVYGTI